MPPQNLYSLSFLLQDKMPLSSIKVIVWMCVDQASRERRESDAIQML